MNRCQAVLFDLDGTLLDTAGDLCYALNKTLRLAGLPALDLDQVRPAVSHGGRAMIRLGFRIGEQHPQFEARRREFLQCYRDNLSRQTTLFPEMDKVLHTLESRQIPWGVVTNKPAWLTEPLMQQLRLDTRSACTVSGDSTAFAKPHAEPLLHACRRLGVNPANCIYVGDHQRDMTAAKAAGMTALAALYGYIDGDPYDWGADGYVNTPMQVLAWLDNGGVDRDD